MATDNQFALLKQRRFAPFFLTQFLGAFNDNVFKNALVILIAFQAGATGAGDSNTLINLSAGLFILPFFLFSATAGQLADKYEKAGLIRKIKALEIIIMLAGAAGFFLGHTGLLIGILFLMGAQSALFGPVKYGLLPQHLAADELVGGNGLVEMGTFLAILLGTLTGGVLISLGDWGVALVSGTVVVIAVLGYLSSRAIPPAAPAAPDLTINWNPITETWRNLTFSRGNRTVFLSILGISWFWFYGGVILAQLPNYTQYTLGGNEQVVTVLLTMFSFGIGIGSLLCERLSGHKVEIGLVPFGSIGLTLFGVDLYFAAPQADFTGELIGAWAFLGESAYWRVLADIVLIGMFGGFYIVPLYALIQTRSEPSHRSRVIAGNNIVNALFMVVSAIMAIILLGVGLTIPQLLLVTALLNAAVAIYIYTLVPEFLMRFLVWLLINTVYRVKLKGLEHIPDSGPAVLVCNHVSYVDALIIAGCCHRPTRFVMDHQIFKIPLLSFFFRTVGAIPIASAKENPELLRRAYDRIAAYLDDGEIICIFPEGQLTRTGELTPFRNGIERIIRRNPVPVIPMALQGLWGSFFSRRHGRAMSRLPRRFWSKIGLAIGTPIVPEYVNATQLQASIAALRGEWR